MLLRSCAAIAVDAGGEGIGSDQELAVNITERPTIALSIRPVFGTAFREGESL